MTKQNLAIAFDNPSLAFQLYGAHNENLNKLAKHLNIELSTKGSELTIINCTKKMQDDVLHVLHEAYELLKKGKNIGEHDLIIAYDKLNNIKKNIESNELFSGIGIELSSQKTINARNIAQEKYFELLKQYEIVFATGPAGTGKTYLAVAMALSFLNNKKVKKIILTRPAVEAGERLGFLPGDMTEKVDPYLRPLYDALYEMLGYQNTKARLENGIIEVAPLAFMRGRTLNDAFIILDEAQNTTKEQMKMFLTRLGFSSRAVITGDVTQIDLLPNHFPNENQKYRSGLVHSLEVLKNVKGIAMHNFDKKDVVRHPLVGKIVAAYEEYESLNS